MGRQCVSGPFMVTESRYGSDLRGCGSGGVESTDMDRKTVRVTPNGIIDIGVAAALNHLLERVTKRA